MFFEVSLFWTQKYQVCTLPKITYDSYHFYRDSPLPYITVRTWCTAISQGSSVGRSFRSPKSDMCVIDPWSRYITRSRPTAVHHARSNHIQETGWAWFEMGHWPPNKDKSFRDLLEQCCYVDWMFLTTIKRQRVWNARITVLLLFLYDRELFVQRTKIYCSEVCGYAQHSRVTTREGVGGGDH